MGLKDVAALAEVTVDAARLGLDPGSLAVLDRYQRWRRFDSAFSAAVMDGLNRLFSNDSAPLRTLRDLGLGIVPDNALAREFRDEAGRLHQRLAAQANRVVFMVAGLPLTVKPSPENPGAPA